MYSIYPAESITGVPQFTHQNRMPPGKTSEKVQTFRELLKAPFQRHKSRGSSPSPAPRPTISRSVQSNAASESSIEESTSTSKGVVSSSRPTHAAGGQSLNPRPPTFPMPARNEAFERAVAVALQKYIDRLSDDDKVAFQSATDVMEKLEELHQDNCCPSTRMQKVQKVLQCVKQFLGSITICIQHSPEVSSLVLGGLNCVLTVTYPLIFQL